MELQPQPARSIESRCDVIYLKDLDLFKNLPETSIIAHRKRYIKISYQKAPTIGAYFETGTLEYNCVIYPSATINCYLSCCKTLRKSNKRRSNLRIFEHSNGCFVTPVRWQCVGAVLCPRGDALEMAVYGSSSSSLHMPGSAGLLTPNGGDNAS